MICPSCGWLRWALLDHDRHMPNRVPVPRRVAVLGGNRLPFARSNSVYADASNQDMLTATLDGLAAPLRTRG